MQRYVSGQVSEQEKKKIEAWLDIKKTEEGADLILSPEDEERLFRTITANIDNVDEIRSFRPRGNARSLFSNRWFQVAATVIILAMTSFTVWFFASRTSDIETIMAYKAEKTILDDGSIVWLQKSSRLTYSNYGDTRKATFTGEGLFEVTKDPERPFTISCGKVKVQVVGTSFNLKSSVGVFELKVLTGTVHVFTGTNEPMIVTASEMVRYDSATGITKAPIDKEELAAIVASTDYNMEFRNTSMEKVISRIESKFDVQVQLADPVVSKCRITADFTDQSLLNTLEMLTELLEIDFAVDGSTVNISGKGCN